MMDSMKEKKRSGKRNIRQTKADEDIDKNVWNTKDTEVAREVQSGKKIVNLVKRHNSSKH